MDDHGSSWLEILGGIAAIIAATAFLVATIILTRWFVSSNKEERKEEDNEDNESGQHCG